MNIKLSEEENPMNTYLSYRNLWRNLS